MELDRLLERLGGKISTLSDRVKTLEQIESPDKSAVAFGLLDSMYLGLPGLVGYWPGSMTDANGRLMDAGANGLHLTNNNVATLNTSGIVPCFEYNGTNQYHSHADDPDLDVLGTETHINSAIRGLTCGAWVKFDTLAASTQYAVLSKWAVTIASASYLIDYFNGIRVLVSDGVGSKSALSTASISTGLWYLVIMRYTPSAEIKVIVNGSENTNTTSVYAALNNSSTIFSVGSKGGANFLDGSVSRSFVCSTSVPDDYLSMLYQYGRRLFGV